jgi:hypothetical protein
MILLLANYTISSIPSAFHLHSVFLPVLSLPLSFSFRYIHSTCALLPLSPQHALHLLSSPSVQYLFSLSSFQHLNLSIIFLSLLSPNFAALFPAFTLSLFLLHSVPPSTPFKYFSCTLSTSSCSFHPQISHVLFSFLPSSTHSLHSFSC